MHIVLVAGAPGSGKSTWCQAQVRAHDKTLWIDDPSVNHPPKFSKSQLAGFDVVMIADPHLTMMNDTDARAFAQRFIEVSSSDTWHGVWCTDLDQSRRHARPKTDNFNRLIAHHFNHPAGALLVDWGFLEITLSDVLNQNLFVSPELITGSHHEKPSVF